MDDSDSKMKVEKSQVRPVTSTPGDTVSKGGRRKSKSMHDGVPVWHDCCSCEAEPYWLEWVDQADLENNS